MIKEIKVFSIKDLFKRHLLNKPYLKNKRFLFSNTVYILPS